MSDSLPTNFDFAIYLTHTPKGLNVDIRAKAGDGEDPPDTEAKAIVTWIAQNWQRIKAEAVGVKVPYRSPILGADGKSIH